MLEAGIIQYLSNSNAVFTATVVIILSVVYYFIKNNNLPPGPTGIPYFGYWPFLYPDTCHLQLQEMTKKYGDVCSFTVTGHLYVKLGSMRSLREAFLTKSEYFPDRNEEYSLLRRLFETGLAFTKSNQWKTLRVFFTQHLKDVGFSHFKGNMAGNIYEIIRDCKKELLQSKGKPVALTDILTKKCNSILRHTLFGDGLISDEEIQRINDRYETVLENMNGTNLLVIGTLARYLILPFTHKYREAMRNLEMMEKSIYDIIDRHKSTYNEDNMRNIIDLYIKERNSRQSKNDSTAAYFTDSALMASLLQFVTDGVVTVGGFLCVFFRSLLDHPEEQEKMYQEIIDIIGTDRDPEIDDKNKLPYTNAFIYEVVRTCTVFPYFPKVQCSRETTISGYRIPKGAVMLLDSWSAHFDPNVYEEPEKFNPSRFIAKEGIKRPDLPVLFGIGKRTCMGESFALSQAFLFVATLLKHFRLSKPEENAGNVMFLLGKVTVIAQPREVK